ncbi:Os10g0555651 [Oryza sativa Japonica Group]|uniref:Os10g0555651 protein n=2 Tax=Oryza sativa subsp. japonica TaxID=39947 RepID=C7J7B4_ORYSJ|nr:hypothetical protein EE612_052707 [Oryza sativa]BAH94993.1 Os10g0555650 [Oryza sativa Japonica Group]BAT11991.1 Os10g0555651 [Oryza sativa Japonica Group]|eukprot:NP_001176265.1 Os10g0555650 [Oryza sativa Japonica Group]
MIDLAELDDGAVVGVGGPVRRDDVVGDERLAGVAADAEGEGRLEAVVGVEAPDGAPRLPHRRPDAGGAAVRRLGLHEVDLHDVAVEVLVLDEHGEVHRVGALLDVEVDLEARVVAGDAPELDVDDARVAELVVEPRLGHGAERRAAQVEVVPGHGVVVHVGDDHRLDVARARRVLVAPDL